MYYVFQFYHLHNKPKLSNVNTLANLHWLELESKNFRSHKDLKYVVYTCASAFSTHFQTNHKFET